MNTRSLDHNVIIDQQQRAWNSGALRLVTMLLVIGLCIHYVGLFDGERLADGGPAILLLLSEMFPPDFQNARSWLKPLIDTLAMSVAGTALAVVLSIPLAFLAARNTTPHPVIYQVARATLNALRSIPELILGIIFVAAVGFGALPGVLALGLHSVGMIGKFFAEAIEHADEAPIEAARAAGATPIQVLLHGVIPQVLPQWRTSRSIAGNTTSVPRLSWAWWALGGHWLRAHGFSAHHAVSGGLGHPACDPAHGYAG